MVTVSDNMGFLPDYALAFWPDKTALIQDGFELSYRQLDQRCNQIAQGLSAAGVGRGDRVFVPFENDARFAEVVFGVMRAGAVATPANPTLSPEILGEILEDCGSRVVLGTAGMAATLGEWRSRDAVDLAIAIDTNDVSGVLDYEAWLAEQSSQRPDPGTTVDEVCYQPYTSGSTGKPKGVLLSHDMLLQNLDTLQYATMIRHDDRALVSTPLFHLNASLLGVFLSIVSGASAVVLPGFDPKRVLENIARYGCTYTQGVPAMYKLLLAEDALIPRTDLSSIRFTLCGSAPMIPEILEEMQQVFDGVTVIEGYGLSESGPVLCMLPRWGVRKTGSIGLPLPGQELRIVGDDGEDVSVGTPGELWSRGPYNCTGYHNRPDLSAEKFTADGWFRTGDMVSTDEDGFLYFRGRVDDMINVAGNNMYPAEVESVLVRHPLIRDAAVVPVAHPLKGQVPVAFVVLRGEEVIDEDEAKQFCLEHVPAFAHPRRVIAVDRVPLGPTGKVDRRRLSSDATQHVEVRE